MFLRIELSADLSSKRTKLNRSRQFCPRTGNQKPLFLSSYSGFQELVRANFGSGSLTDASAMADSASAAAPPGASSCCCFCGLWYETTSGRSHGQKFYCHVCNAADKQLRRNLGEKSELEALPEEEQKQFFRRLQEERKAAGKYLPWKTVRAQLIAMKVTRHITEQSTDVTTEELPLTVWQARGWDAETVKNCPREWSETLKIHLYKVPTKKVVWKEVHQSVSERILRQEREAEKVRKGKKVKNAGSEDDMDLPEAQSTEKDKGKNEQKEAKAAEAAVRKTQQMNNKMNMAAAKSVGQLSNDLQSLTKAYSKASNIPENVNTTCQETHEKLAKWVGAAKATLQQAEDEPRKEWGNRAVAVALRVE